MLGLPAGSVRNIIMHRDIVPRAFMCDYTIVADLLQRWVPSFKSHKGLAAHHSHKVLYTFVGDMQVRAAWAGRPACCRCGCGCCSVSRCRYWEICAGKQRHLRMDCAARSSLHSGLQQPAHAQGSCHTTSAAYIEPLIHSALAPAAHTPSPAPPSPQVLQPSTTLSFVRQGEDHGMLPPGAALYKLVQPLEDSVCSLDQEEQGQEGQEGSSCGLLDQGTATVSDAMLEFMNSPHPMETLSDPRAYGHQGMISRYHNPVNYAHALSALLP
jgi:hypothetical protein